MVMYSDCHRHHMLLDHSPYADLWSPLTKGSLVFRFHYIASCHFVRICLLFSNAISIDVTMEITIFSYCKLVWRPWNEVCTMAYYYLMFWNQTIFMLHFISHWISFIYAFMQSLSSPTTRSSRYCWSVLSWALTCSSLMLRDVAGPIS